MRGRRFRDKVMLSILLLALAVIGVLVLVLCTRPRPFRPDRPRARRDSHNLLQFLGIARSTSSAIGAAEEGSLLSPRHYAKKESAPSINNSLRSPEDEKYEETASGNIE